MAQEVSKFGYPPQLQCNPSDSGRFGCPQPAEFYDLQNRYSEALALLQQSGSHIKFIELRLAEKNQKIRELEKLSSTDPLTGLMNRRGFKKFFLQEQERSRRNVTQGSILLLFDLNKFKSINDIYGHQAGDQCLKTFAECLLRNIRSIDGAARIGGDEFAVILSNTDTEKSQNCIRQITQSLQSLRATWAGAEIPISASIGIKYVSAALSFEAACCAADEGLYQNKRLKNPVGNKNYKIINLGSKVITESTPPPGSPAIMQGSQTTLSQLLLGTL